MSYQADECCDNVAPQPQGQQSDPDRAAREAKQELEFQRHQELSRRDDGLRYALQLAGYASREVVASDVVAAAEIFYTFLSSNGAK